MSDTYIPGLMELDSFWESAVRDAVEDTIHDRKRLEFALENRNKINKRLESLGYSTVPKQKKFSESVNAEEDCEDDITEADSLNESDSGDDLGAEAVRNRNGGPKAKGKVKNMELSEDYKIKKSNLEFVHEPMDIKFDKDDEDEDDNEEEEEEEDDNEEKEEEDDNEEKEEEDDNEEKEEEEDEDEDCEDYEEESNLSRISQLRQTPYEQAKKKLSVMITEMKRMKEKGEKRRKMRSKCCKSKNGKNKLDKKAGYDNRRKSKSEIQGKMSEVNNKEGVTATAGAAVNMDSVENKEGNQDGTRGVVGDKGEGQNHFNTNEEPSKNGAVNEIELRDSDFRYSSMSESGESCWSDSILGVDDFS